MRVGEEENLAVYVFKKKKLAPKEIGCGVKRTEAWKWRGGKRGKRNKNSRGRKKKSEVDQTVECWFMGWAVVPKCFKARTATAIVTETVYYLKVLAMSIMLGENAKRLDM